MNFTKPFLPSPQIVLLFARPKDIIIIFAHNYYYTHIKYNKYVTARVHNNKISFYNRVSDPATVP